MKKEILTAMVENEIKIVSKFVPYREDKTYFAVIGKDLYYKDETLQKYLLLKKDYMHVSIDGHPFLEMIKKMARR